jgi:hypothetical protein
VIEYARWLGVEEGEDDELLWVAREGLTAKLPPNWKPWYVVLFLSDTAALCVSQCCITPTPRRNAPRFTAELALPLHSIRLRCVLSHLTTLSEAGVTVGSCSRDDNGEIYYFNFKTGESEWDHPCDAIFHEKCVTRCPFAFRPS